MLELLKMFIVDMRKHRLIAGFGILLLMLGTANLATAYALKAMGVDAMEMLRLGQSEKFPWLVPVLFLALGFFVVKMAVDGIRSEKR